MSSPLQNRVTPKGEIVAYPARGLFMGNRGGRLHRPDRALTRSRWKSRSWIICQTDFRGRRRQVMGAGYTELFFLDEATALAAGHRPCFECRRAAAMAFATLFPGTGRTRAAQIDRVLHVERLAAREIQPMDALPDGTMIETGDDIYLLHAGRAHLWHITGYGPCMDVTSAPVTVLTPASTRAVLSAGYAVRLHPSLPAG